MLPWLPVLHVLRVLTTLAGCQQQAHSASLSDPQQQLSHNLRTLEVRQPSQILIWTSTRSLYPELKTRIIARFDLPWMVSVSVQKNHISDPPVPV